jgi:malonate-semialdehyde dehydrogenase (acetylating)/methylmalonate-semialdehyde dehydrogenase
MPQLTTPPSPNSPYPYSPKSILTHIMSIQVNNFINNLMVPPSSGQYLNVENPCDLTVCAEVAVSNAADVAAATAAASAAFPAWSGLTMKARAAIMMNFHHLIKSNAQHLAELIVLENGKNMTEALADVAKGNETVEYSCSLPQLAQGKNLTVSTGIGCRDERRPLGVVASIVPFNFPLMVPMWTSPIALVMGNCVIVKPSEKVPLTMNAVAKLIVEAGFPPGVFQCVHGTREACEALIDSPEVSAVTFVGSTPIAKSVADRCHNLNKKVIALGGAKNHLVALPDCGVQDTIKDIVASFAGAAGQRCMAATVLLVVGDGPAQDAVISGVVDLTSKLVQGTAPGQLGPVIDQASKKKIVSYIEASEKGGAKILLDGRDASKFPANNGAGNWLGPTLILHSDEADKALHDEIFVSGGYTIELY